MKKISKRSTAKYISKLKQPNKKLIGTIRKIILKSFPDVEETISWGWLSYKKNGYLCSLMYTKDYVRIEFFQGTKIKDPKHLLEGTGKKLRHVKIRKISEINRKQTIDWLRQSIKLNQK